MKTKKFIVLLNDVITRVQCIVGMQMSPMGRVASLGLRKCLGFVPVAARRWAATRGQSESQIYKRPEVCDFGFACAL